MALSRAGKCWVFQPGAIFSQLRPCFNFCWNLIFSLRSVGRGSCWPTVRIARRVEKTHQQRWGGRAFHFWKREHSLKKLLLRRNPWVVSLRKMKLLVFCLQEESLDENQLALSLDSEWPIQDLQKNSLLMSKYLWWNYATAIFVLSTLPSFFDNSLPDLKPASSHF